MSDTSLDASTYDDEHYPARRGDWIASGEPITRVAQIKRVYRHSDGFLADLIFYDFNGNKLGRVSPPMGGPRTFEPACALRDWYRIKPPEFPIRLSWKYSKDRTRRTAGYHAARRPWGKYARRRKLVVEAVQTTRPNYDPELERRARKLAAEKLRDLARTTGLAVLLAEADALEREIDNL